MALRQVRMQSGRPHRGPQRRRGGISFLETLSTPKLALLGIVGGAALGIAAAALGPDGRGKLLSYMGLSLLSSCNIKGNISFYSGERIYHVPGQEHYLDTIIDPLKGERYFCSEAEARAAGWRRAGI